MSLRTTVATDPAIASGAQARDARRGWSWQRFGVKFLVLSVLAHLLLLAFAGYMVVDYYSARHKQTFTPSAKGPNASSRALEHKMQQKRQKSGGSPPNAKRVTTTNTTTKFVLPAMPAMPSMPVAPMSTSLTGLGIGNGFGNGLGSGAGSGIGGTGAGRGINLFGVSAGAGLSGSFYDLKQTKAGQPTPDMAASLDANTVAWGAPANSAYDGVLAQFVKGGMGESFIYRFFRSPSPLFTKQIYIPRMDANNGPKAFGLDDKVQPKRWIVVYRGKVTAPESGGYRFAGFADDVMVVRFNGQIALHASLYDALGVRPTTTYTYANGIDHLYVSNQVNVSAGANYPIDIMIGERPGGSFKAYLLVEKVGAELQKAPSGAPILPIWKFAAGDSPPEGGDSPPIAADTSWSVWKAVAPTAVSSVFNH